MKGPIVERGLLSTIPDHKRQNLPRIMKQLGMTQKDIADALDLSAGAISKYVATGPGHARLRPERVEQLVQVLKQRLAECQERAFPSKGSGMDQPPVATIPLLSAETISSLRTEIDELLAVEDENPEPPSAPIIATPTGALPVNASNYVERAADREVDDILTLGRSPASIIVGPINGGTSSFLNRVYQQARAKPECWARIVHLDAAFADGESFTQLDLFRYLVRKIGVPDVFITDGDIDVDGMKVAFDKWAREAWKGASRIVLIIDGLDQVFKNAGSIADPLTLINWLGALRNEAALGQPPYNKLALFVALTGKTWSAAHASPYASQAASLLLKKFNDEEITQVFDQLQVDRSRYDAKEVQLLFHGHPYLTQLFAWSMHKGSSEEQAKQAALDLEGPYENHWERMKSEIQFLLGNNYKLDRLFAAITEAIERPGQLRDEIRDMWLTYQRDLRVFGLLDGTGNAPSICKFYKTAIEHERNMVAGEGTRKRFIQGAPLDAN